MALVWQGYSMTTWVFLRGLTRESRHWGSFPETFRAAIPDAVVVTLDLPGNGRLHALQSLLTVREMAEYCRAGLRRQGVLPPYHLLAMSLGAMVAVAWATSHPEELGGSVLINTSLRAFSPFYRRLRPANYVALLRLILIGGNDRDWEETILRLTSRLIESPADILTDWISYRREYPVTSRNAIRQVLAAARYRAPPVKPAIPMLVLVSNGDALVDDRCSKRLAHEWKADIVEHPTAGHDIPLDDGVWVARQVREWLSSTIT